MTLELFLSFLLGVVGTLTVQAFVAAWQAYRAVPEDPPADIVDAENVIRIQKWVERREETDKTFGRWA